MRPLFEILWGDFPFCWASQVMLVKNPPANIGHLRDVGSIPESGRFLGGGQDNPLQYSCLENLHGERNPVGYSPWGRKESDTNEHIDTDTQDAFTEV